MAADTGRAAAPALAAFKGLSVVDLSQGIAGPYCAQLLALQGADVVKVEPLEGDWLRPLGTPGRAMSALFAAFNRGKRGIAVDLKSAQGLAIVAELAARADVLVENFRPGVTDRLGVGYEAVAARNPGIVYVSVTGFGQSGPASGRPATDTIVQAHLGMAHFNRDRDGTPRKVPIVPVDVATGLYACQAASAALYERLSVRVNGGEGRGRHLDISLLQSAAAFQAGKMLEYHLDEGAPPPEQSSPVGLYPAKDGMVAIITLRDNDFAALARTLGLDALIDDPRFRRLEGRMTNREALDAAIAGATGQRSVAELLAALEEADVNSAQVRDYAAALADGALDAAGIVSWFEQPRLGRLPAVSPPGTDAGTLSPAPRLGQHTGEVLREIGHRAEEIAALAGSGAISPA
jgi:crotonobetainyl-CoA:carnitine CoA-transferase CaiB-like acyl-CoA transferase